jgi:membrane-associated phospholipid phosphatase
MEKYNKWSYTLRPISVEVLFGGYLIVTAVFILFNLFRIEHPYPMLFFRMAYLLATALLIYISSRSPELRWIRFLRLSLPFLLIVWFYQETDLLNNILFPQYLDPYFAHLEEAWFHSQPSLIFAERISNRGFAELMYFGYVSFYALTIGVPAWLYFRVDKIQAARFTTLIITSFTVYYLVFIVLPVAGPQYYFQDSVDPLPRGYVFGPLLQMAQKLGEGRTAAFPSSHVAICLMIVWGCFRYARRLVWYVVPVAVILIISTVYIRAHYVIDVIAGIVTAPLVYTVSGWLFARLDNGLRQSQPDQIITEGRAIDN